LRNFPDRFCFTRTGGFNPLKPFTLNR